jgi:hypothetical protein
MASSPEDQVTDAGESEGVKDVDAAESSGAEQGGTMLDAVTAALDKGKEPSPGSESGSARDAAPQSIDGEKPKSGEIDPDHMSDDEIAKLHHKTTKHIKKLVSQLKDVESHVSTLRPKAEQFDLITERIRQTGLEGPDLNNLFEIGALMKRGDLFAARDKIMPYVEAIAKATGTVLPPDLEQAQKAGQISAQHASELAEMRSRSALTQNQMQMREQQYGQETARQFLGQVVNSVNDWEAAKKRTDPDWSLKAPEVQAAIELAILKGQQPRTVQDAVKMAENALAGVDARFKQYRPQPKAVRNVSGSPQASTAAGAPKSMLEAVLQSLG